MKRPIILFVNALQPQLNTIYYGVYLAKSFELPLLLYSVQYTPTPIYAEPGIGTTLARTLARTLANPVLLEEKGRKALADLHWLTLWVNKFSAVLSLLYLPKDEKTPD